MADRKKVSYSFRELEDWQKHNQTVTTIVKEDTGAEHWISNRALPPTSFPPPLSLDGIEKLKGLEGVIVEDIVEEKKDA
ncbi:hypothetical protein QQX98_002295 [Neonectria punicea]|uniref:Uncharacterized protein n=1 Tax=Neonectria punicea TaxID=979145 RepID=A0ABR1HJ97_9HYPO